MHNEAQVVVTDGETFKQLSAAQRVITVFKLNGHTDAQIENLTRRHGHIGVLINNLATCRDPKLRELCAKNREAFEAELMANRSPDPNAPLTVLEELDITIAVAGDAVVPPRLKQVFSALNQFQADPA